MEGTIIEFTDIIRLVISGGVNGFISMWTQFKTIFSPKDAFAFIESITVLLMPAFALFTGYMTKMMGSKFKYGLLGGALAGIVAFFIPQTFNGKGQSNNNEMIVENAKDSGISISTVKERALEAYKEK
ncbi:MAG: hypothetical protein ACI9CD_000041 [Candidatus Deianiraeaceae bacterium]|jgi:hypothetical protein